MIETCVPKRNIKNVMHSMQRLKENTSVVLRTCSSYNLKQYANSSSWLIFSPKKYCNFRVFFWGRFKKSFNGPRNVQKLQRVAIHWLFCHFIQKSIDGDFVKASNKRLLYECCRCLLTLATLSLIIESFLTRVAVISTFALSLNSSNFLSSENE